MRISDWSSDVCSSDLLPDGIHQGLRGHRPRLQEGLTNSMTAAVSVTPQTGHRNLIGLSRDELAAELAPHGIDGFRLRQVWHWLYHRGGRNFAEMTTLSKPVRALPEAHYTDRQSTRLNSSH